MNTHFAFPLSVLLATRILAWREDSHPWGRGRPARRSRSAAQRLAIGTVWRAPASSGRAARAPRTRCAH